MMTKQSLPKGWRWAKLGDVCEFTYGESLPLRERNSNGNIPVYGSNGVIGYHDKAVTKGKTIIVGRKGSIGEVNLSYSPCFPIDTTYYIEKGKEELDLVWLFFWLKALNLSKFNKAAAVPGLNREDAYALEIPLPPLEEQKRIAARLDEQMRHIKQARLGIEEQIDLLNALVNSYLRQSLQAKTTKMSLAECIIEVKKGVGETWEQYPVLGATRDGVAPAKERVGKQPQRYKLVEPGTIFYNPMRIMIGSIAMLDDGEESGITSPDYVVLKGKQGILHPRWFYYWFRSPYGEAFIKSLARGAVRERMLFNRLEKGEIKVPNWDTQVKVAEKLKEIKAFKQALESQLAEIEALPSAVLGQAFGGELWEDIQNE